MFLIILSIEKGLGVKEKMKLPSLRLFDNPLSKYLTFKIIPECYNFLSDKKDVKIMKVMKDEF